MLEVDNLKQFLNNALYLQSKANRWDPIITSFDEIREQINSTKEAVETVMTRAVPSNPMNNPMRRSEYQPPTYARGEQAQEPQRPKHPQFQQQKPSTARGGYQQPDPFFGGFQQGGFPGGFGQQRNFNQSYNPYQ